jgi:hypothetical protein
MTGPAKPFPCPFCESSRVSLVGGGLVFLHYQCSQCSEVWTAMASTPKIHRQKSTPDTDELDASAGIPAPKVRKIWLN